jgi:hypothetical protein
MRRGWRGNREKKMEEMGIAGRRVVTKGKSDMENMQPNESRTSGICTSTGTWVPDN